MATDLSPRLEAEQRFRAGDLAGALAELQAAVRSHPADAKLRIFLAQVMMLIGEWDRALNQLKLVGEMDASALPMMHAYSAAIHCERLRADVFAGTRSPLLFGEPAPWMALLLTSVGLHASGRVAEAAGVRAEALESAPATAGTLNGEAFTWIADADSRLGPMLEVLLNESYYWVPFERISRLRIEPPGDVRDLVWVPAEFTWTNGGQAMGFIPTRYSGSEKCEDAALRMSRRTEWVSAGEDAYVGLGQRVLTTDGPELGLLEVRDLRLGSVS